MGGKGSGTWYRGCTKTTTEETKRIDIRYMRKQGLLKLNTTGSLKWTCHGEPSGDIRYTCFSDHLKLNFRYREYGGEWGPIEQRVPFDRTPCHYGGERLWFRCPHCNKRVAVLYGYEIRFLCRHCYQIPYSSQQEGYMNNVISQKHKLGERIFEHYDCGEGWGKKKGLHWKTFNRLHARYQALENQWVRYMGQHLGLN
jgi:hypothetical protein